MRAVRQMALGLLILYVLGISVLGILVARFQHVSAPLDRATARAEGTITHVAMHDGQSEAEVLWEDSRSRPQTNIVRLVSGRSPEPGDVLTVRYVPGDPERIFVSQDTTFAELRNIAAGAVWVVLLLILALLVTLTRLIRRIWTSHRPAIHLRAWMARSKWGLFSRRWLVLFDGTREWWVPVYWDVALANFSQDTRCAVRGMRTRHAPLIVDVGDSTIWPAGRRRPSPPRGELDTSPSHLSTVDTAKWKSVVRQLPRELPLLISAPLLGLLWSYFNDSGAGGFWLSTVVLAGVLLWLPSQYGSDPT